MAQVVVKLDESEIKNIISGYIQAKYGVSVDTLDVESDSGKVVLVVAGAESNTVDDKYREFVINIQQTCLDTVLEFDQDIKEALVSHMTNDYPRQAIEYATHEDIDKFFTDVFQSEATIKETIEAIDKGIKEKKLKDPTLTDEEILDQTRTELKSVYEGLGNMFKSMEKGW